MRVQRPARFNLHPATKFLLSALLLTVPAYGTATPAVVASIKPVELLVKAVAGDQVTVSTLVPDGASPHTYQLRPSERARLEQAAQVFWIGPDMETFLIRLLGGQDLAKRTVRLAPDDSAETPSGDAPSGGHGHDHDNGHDDRHHDDQKHDDGHAAGHGHQPQPEDSHGHDHDGKDPHLWVDPELGLAMAQTIADALGGLEGVDQAQIQRNLATFRQALRAAETDIRQQLAQAHSVDLFTYHDAFGRFVEHFGLKLAGVLTPSPERTPGARHLAEVRTRLGAASNPCLLTEPQFNRQWWLTVTEGMHIPTGTWDPLASGIASDADGYIRFQYSMAEAVLGCLPEHAQK